MKNVFNVIRCIVLLGAGVLILLAPYEKIKLIFPNAPSPAIVKIMGVIAILCGIVITIMFSGL